MASFPSSFPPGEITETNGRTKRTRSQSQLVFFSFSFFRFPYLNSQSQLTRNQVLLDALGDQSGSKAKTKEGTALSARVHSRASSLLPPHRKKATSVSVLRLTWGTGSPQKDPRCAQSWESLVAGTRGKVEEIRTCFSSWAEVGREDCLGEEKGW